VLCDFVDGFAFGSALGVGLQSSTDWWRVTHITQKSALEAVRLGLKHTIRLAKGQTRLLPLEISQITPFFGDEIAVDVHLESAQGAQILPITLPVKHWEGPRAIRASFFFANSIPSIFCAIPPPVNTDTPSIPVVALRNYLYVVPSIMLMPLQMGQELTSSSSTFGCKRFQRTAMVGW